MPLGKGVRFRVKTTKRGKRIRLAFRGKGKVVEAKNLATGATHTPAEFARDAAQMPDDMGQVHVGGRSVRQPKRALGKFVLLVGLGSLLMGCATVPPTPPTNPTQESRELYWASGGFTVETADEGVCLPLHLLPRMFDSLGGDEPPAHKEKTL